MDVKLEKVTKPWLRGWWTILGQPEAQQVEVCGIGGEGEYQEEKGSGSPSIRLATLSSSVCDTHSPG